MGATAAITLLAICLFCYILGLTGLIIGCYGHAWWIFDTATYKKEMGLWKVCERLLNAETVCTTRKDLFDFDGKQNAEKDTILIILITAAVFCFLAFLTTLLMICYRKREGSWKCSALVSFSVSLIGALIAFAGLGYAEFEFESEWSTNDHGWSVLLAWIGAAAQLLAAVISCILMFVVPTESGSKQTVHYVGNTNPTYQADYYR
ncbi:uncharacterized protein LOC130641452 [Hydractinia symbiolongicarpus]|uniref:uncharacterized protein LOC130641452 n=1 Tax=Hydractinia symbiolongicarpus TaxID=13093 RepID=UPI002550BDB4|nr:uncharacterized protein LOC130641452 [Hydractinia symbiolongicarpus]XP_057304239.1 uncharacterized protein LOC130641452 [Hydractinia symbiolongicarpus]